MEIIKEVQALFDIIGDILLSIYQLGLIHIIIAYAIGSFSMSHLIAKRKGINLKETGSRNYGASNTLIMIGKKEALIVLISDVSKGFFTVLVSTLIYSTLNISNTNVNIIPIIGSAVILGHIFPFYLKLKGGKGFATYIGVVLAHSLILFDGPVFIIAFVLPLILALISDYIIVGTLSMVTIFSIYWLTLYPLEAIPLIITSIIIWVKHFENIKNIRNKTEPKISEKLNYRRPKL